MQRRMRGKVLLAVGVVGAVAAILILLTTVGEQSTQAAVAQSASEGFSTVGVVHARFLDASGRVKVEEWLDKRTGATRRVELGGVGGDQITVQDGRTIVSWNSRGLGAVWEARAIDPNDPWLEDASNLLRFRTALRSGRARVIGSATVQGKPTWVVKPEPRFGEETPVAVDVRAYLDKETLLPARILVRRGKDELSVPIVVEEAPEGTVPDSSFVPNTNRSGDKP